MSVCVTAIVVVFILLVGMAVMDLNIIDKATYFFENDIMKLHDANRGVDSGLTGRTAAYEKAWAAFTQSPFIGNGYGEFGFVHNGFLITLAESGLFGLFGMLFLLGRSIYAHIRAKHIVGLGFIVSYTVAIMTYPRTFNVNSTSLLFLIILMGGMALKHGTVRPVKNLLLKDKKIRQ